MRPRLAVSTLRQDNEIPESPAAHSAPYLEDHLMSTTVDSALVADLAAHVSGSVLRAQDAGYEAARTAHNGLIDRRPGPVRTVTWIGLCLP